MGRNYQAHQYGDAKPVVTKAIASATVIEQQDLVAQVTADGLVYPASAHVWNTNIATTQAEFVALFLGVSTEFSRAGDVAPIKVNTAGVHEFECAAAQFKIGDLVGPAKQTGDLLENRKVVAVGAENLSIGRVARDYPANTTTVLVDVYSSKMKPKVA
jgi:hypothetical protein